MQIQIDKLVEKTTIAITGQETWLESLYRSLGGQGNATPLLTGQVTLSPLPFDQFHLQGAFQFRGAALCNRCTTMVPVAVGAKCDTVFRPETEDEVSGSGDLSPEFLDLYFVKNKAIDVEQYLIDQINYHLPSRTLCQHCEPEGDKSLIFSSKNRDTSPFSVLKDLKLN